MACKGQPTTDELAKALEHVRYEFWMLQQTADKLLALDWPTAPHASDDEKVLRNALVESFAVHSRILFEFLWHSDDKRDMTADCYVSSRESAPDRLDRTIDLYAVTSRRIVHLSRDRIHKYASDEGWDVKTIRDEIAAGMMRFFATPSVQHLTQPPARSNRMPAVPSLTHAIGTDSPSDHSQEYSTLPNSIAPTLRRDNS